MCATSPAADDATHVDVMKATSHTLGSIHKEGLTVQAMTGRTISCLVLGSLEKHNTVQPILKSPATAGSILPTRREQSNATRWNSQFVTEACQLDFHSRRTANSNCQSRDRTLPQA